MYRPKVGEWCEYAIRNTNNWYVCNIIDIGEVGIYIHCPHLCDDNDDGNQWVNYKQITLRAKKSKRDEEIEEMVAVMEGYATYEAMAKGMHSKGYRKQLPYSQFFSIIQCYLITLGYPDSKALSYSQELANLLGRVEDTL